MHLFCQIDNFLFEFLESFCMVKIPMENRFLFNRTERAFERYLIWHELIILIYGPEKWSEFLQFFGDRLYFIAFVLSNNGKNFIT